MSEDFQPTILSVAAYLELVNNVMRQNVPSQEIYVQGELFELNVKDGKWINFTLKDEEDQATVKCFATVWKVDPKLLEEGMTVRVKGIPKIYERFGNFSINVDEIQLVGEGALQKAYELLKKKLQEEGLFDPARKRSLPRFVSHIGIITSRDAAAFGDFKRVLNNRWGGVSVSHAHVHVQGREAVPDILGAFKYFNALPAKMRPEVLVLTRGGGSLEDLHAFNDEQVARAVFQSKIPVVCGVGHERDESLCDFAADVRASTPSNAAERIVPDRQQVLYEISAMTERTADRMEYQIYERQRVVDSATRAISFVLERQKIRLESIAMQIHERFSAWLPRLRDQIMSHERLLQNLDPKRILDRGYSIVRVGKKIIRDASKVDIGTEIGVQLSAGTLDAEVLRVNKKGKQKLV